jgi:hypothetical protein
LVDFICVGAQKAGTTWLWGQLRQHPDVAFPPVKEVHYFDSLTSERVWKRRQARMAERCSEEIAALQGSDDPSAPAEIERYRRYMDPSFIYTDPWYAYLYSAVQPGQKGGDFTPAYSALPDTEVDHVKRVAPDARIIYMIRDPHERAISSLKMMTSTTAADKVMHADYYFDRGDYRSSVPRWDQRFGDQILYLPFGDVRDRPFELLRQVEQHIGLKPYDGYTGVDVPVSSTGAWSTLEITPEIDAHVQQLFAPQYAFLKSRFSEDFIARIA